MTSRVPTDSGILDSAAGTPLSRFEVLCLCQRTLECRALLQLAVLGAERAQEQHPCRELEAIAEQLLAAEQLLEAACATASRWRDR